MNGGRTPREERIQKWKINNQLEAGESDNHDNSVFMDPDQAEEDKEEEEEETDNTKNDTPKEE